MLIEKTIAILKSNSVAISKENKAVRNVKLEKNPTVSMRHAYEQTG